MDYFQLASMGGGESESEQVIWKLVKIQKESPLVVEGEAISFDPDIDVDEIAKKQKNRLERGIRSVSQGIIPDEWSSQEASRIVERVFHRSSNGIGKTSIILDFSKDSAPIEITPQLAVSAISAIYKQPSHLFAESLSRVELGSVDGYLEAVGVYYGQPALQILDRLTNTATWCRVPAKIIDDISESMRLKDIWQHRRVIVRGVIRYDKSGTISSINDAEIDLITPKEVSLDEITDREFTQGMSPHEYLDKFHEGNLG